jgi:WD40 repeat protein
VQESELEYVLLFYSIDGRQLSRYQAYEDALGVKTVSMASGGHLIAIGSYDEKVRLLNTTTWKPVTEFDHKPPGVDDGVCVYDEVVGGREEEVDGGKENVSYQSSGSKSTKGRKAEWKADTQHSACDESGGRAEATQFASSCVPRVIPNIRPDPTKPNPRMGVGLLSWSVDCRYLLSRNDNMPNTLWIWRMDKLKLGESSTPSSTSCPHLMSTHTYSPTTPPHLTILSTTTHIPLPHLIPPSPSPGALVGQIGMVRSARWSPTANKLAVCTGNAKLYLWSPKGVSWIGVPTDEFEVKGLRWCPSGDSVALLGKSHLCCCYFDDAGVAADAEQ